MRPRSDLRPSQHTLIDAGYEHDEQLLIAGMGAGKTAGTLTAVRELLDDDVIDRALILAPPLVAATVWPSEPGKWEHLSSTSITALTAGPEARKVALRDRWGSGVLYSMSFHLCQWLKQVEEEIEIDRMRTMLVFDETSFLKGARSKNGKALREIASRFCMRIGLTGTPRPNGHEDLWGQYQMLTADSLFEEFDSWRRRNFMPLDFKGYQWRVHEFRAVELDRKMAPYTTRVEADLDLPPLNEGLEFDTFVDLPPAARQRYDEMEEDCITRVIENVRRTMEGKELTEEQREAVIVAALSQAIASAKLAQIAQGYLYDEGEAVSELHEAKVEALRDMVHSCEGENVLIWYGYRHDVDLIERALGAKKPLPRLGSGPTQGQKKRWIEAFGRGELPVLLAHPASAAHGIDELKNGGRRMIWFCPTWSAEQYEQALKRLDRPGQTRPVFSHQIVARHTVDEVKLNRVAYKLGDQGEWVRLIEKVRNGL